MGAIWGGFWQPVVFILGVLALTGMAEIRGLCYGAGMDMFLYIGGPVLVVIVALGIRAYLRIDPSDDGPPTRWYGD